MESTNYKATSETINEAEPGRKYESTPEEHLKHLLNMGWDPQGPLIQRYLRKRGLCLPSELQKPTSSAIS